ncbi:hypothetical protein ACN0TX_12190 [Staphylococcus cohnii]|uniref:hypothetical protein n=1 Tax=Staphylococcus cohnii TaxID=29382 RepID=UPI003AF99DB9
MSNEKNNGSNKKDEFYDNFNFENFLTEQKESNSSFPSQKKRTSVKLSLEYKPLLDTIQEIEGVTRISLVNKILEEYVENHYPEILETYYAGELKYQKRMREDGLL